MSSSKSGLKSPITEDPSNNSHTDEETIALKKKRSRRVSFADREITSVHIFNRDDDFDNQEDEVAEFCGDLDDGDDCNEMPSPTAVNDDDIDDVLNARKSFFMPVESPSPGNSSIIGSATSNDEDNFFGPVSASFIRPGRLSDSAASDSNHDVTMDSTAFSMHYRSLARSESGDLKIPTEVGHAIEDKTPTNFTTPSDPGSFMALTNDKKVISQKPLAFEEVTGGRDSNDMSIVGENLRSYDYGKLSPDLATLLSEGVKDLEAAPAFISDSTDLKLLESTKVSMFEESGSTHICQKELEGKETAKVDRLAMSAKEAVPVAGMELDEANCISVTTHTDQYSSPHRTQCVIADASAHHLVLSPIQLSKVPAADQASEVQTPNQPSEVQTANQMSKLQTPNEMIEVNNAYNKATISMGIELPATSIGITSKMNSSGLKLNSSRNQECRQHSTEVCLKENSPKDQQHGSISSLSAKRRQIYLDASKTCRQLSYATPSPNQPASFICKGNNRSGGIRLSVHKSNSKFKNFEPSPLACSLKDGIEKSKLRLSKLLSPATSFNPIVEENSKETEGKHVNAPVMNLEKHFSGIDTKNRDHERLINKDHYDTESPNNIGNLQKTGGINGASVIPGLGSSLVEIKLDLENPIKTINAPDKFVSPSLMVFEQKLSSVTNHQESLSGDLKQQLLFDELVSIDSRQDRNLVGNVSSSSHPTVGADKFLSQFDEMRPQSGSPYLDVNNSENSYQVKLVDGGQGNLHNRHQMSESLLHTQTPGRERNALNIHSGIPDRNIVIAAAGTSHSEEEFSEERNKSSPHGSASLVSPYNTDEVSLKNPSVKELTRSNEQTQCLSMKEPCNVLNDDHVQLLVEKDILSPKSNSQEDGNNDNHLIVHDSQSRFHSNDFKTSSGRKRKIEEPVLEDSVHADEFKRIQSSPNSRNWQSDLELVPESFNASINGREMVIGGMMVKHWNDVSHKFSADTEQLLSPSHDKLNMKTIGVLQDILVHLQKVKTFELFCSPSQLQKTCDPSSKIRNKRVDETRLVLSKLVFEKARLQLMSIKHKKLLKRAQHLSSAMQKSQMLKINSFWHTSMCRERNIPVDLQNSCIVECGSNSEDFWQKVLTLRHESEDLNRKIKSLTNFFHSFCKIKGDTSCAETILLVNDHLKKRTSCSFIHKDLRLWEVEDLTSRKGQQHIVLNYQGFIHQSFSINTVPTCSLYISNHLNDTTIMKSFPNMDARSAFASVLNSEATRKYAGSKSLAQETQITSSLLLNLLDVIEEVQLAQIEIRNLVQTSFFSPSEKKLYLLLCFVDFNTGWKVTVTLDMTCLNRGIYPSAAVPYQFQASTDGTCKLLPESFSAEVKAAVDDLSIGSSRIIRLCRCVSQLVRSFRA